MNFAHGVSFITYDIEMQASDKKCLFLCWYPRHGRSDELASRLGFRLEYVYPKGRLRYLKSALQTIKILREQQPDVVLVMQPPIFVLLVAYLFSTAKIYADLHSGVFYDPKWRWSLWFTVRLLRGRGGAITTLPKLAARMRNQKVSAFSIHDPITLHRRYQRHKRKRQILVPLSYSYDEPISEILKVCRALPNEKFILTGRAPTRHLIDAPHNVEFTGFVTHEKYQTLLKNSLIVLALTSEKNTMQRAGYEALSSGANLVISNHANLRSYFQKYAYYCDNSANSIIAAVRMALANKKSKNISIARSRIRELQFRQLAVLKKALSK